MWLAAPAVLRSVSGPVTDTAGESQICKAPPLGDLATRVLVLLIKEIKQGPSPSKSIEMQEDPLQLQYQSPPLPLLLLSSPGASIYSTKS